MKPGQAIGCEPRTRLDLGREPLERVPERRRRAASASRRRPPGTRARSCRCRAPRESSGSTSAGVVSGSSRQSTVISHSAGMTLRWCDASIIVGESVNESSGSTRSREQSDRRARARASASSSGGSLTERRLEKALRLRDQLQRRLVRAERLQVASRLHERVVGDARHRRMAAPPVNAHLERRGHLLGGRAQVDRRAAEHEPLAASFVDRVVAARRVGVRLDEPAEPVAARRPPRPRRRGGRDRRTGRIPRARATRTRRRSPRPGPSCRARRAPRPRRRRDRPTRGRDPTRPDPRGRCPCARGRRAKARHRPRIRATRLARCGSRA